MLAFISRGAVVAVHLLSFWTAMTVRELCSKPDGKLRPSSISVWRTLLNGPFGMLMEIPCHVCVERDSASLKCLFVNGTSRCVSAREHGFTPLGWHQPLHDALHEQKANYAEKLGTRDTISSKEQGRTQRNFGMNKHFCLKRKNAASHKHYENCTSIHETKS